MTDTRLKALDALNFIPADTDRDTWVRAGMAAHAAGLSFEDFDTWSATAGNYDAAASRDTWRSFKEGKGIGTGTLYRMAADHGWSNGKQGRVSRVVTTQATQATRPTRAPAPGMSAAEVWSRCEPATYDHGYIGAKQAAGVPLEHLRVVPTDDPLVVAGQRMAGALVVPAYNGKGELQSLQLIPPPEAGKKLNLPGSLAGARHIVGDLEPGGVAYICEGIGAAWSCWQATGRAAVVAFGSGNMGRIAAELRDQDADAKLVLVADTGMEKKVEGIAKEVGCTYVPMPEGWPQNSDVNDMAVKDGLDTLADWLELEPIKPAAELPLGIVFAHDLPEDYTPPDELIEGVLTVGAGSVIYGDSNSGKTFMVIDMACAIARGVPWMGRQVEQGLVVYVAAESPASVKGRLQAYQIHHGVKVPNFAIVTAPVNLHNNEIDTEALILAIKQVERLAGKPAKLVVGDTLARLSAGANENSGEDMGLVVQRFDRIRAETGAHFLLIHHSGKDAAKGARGHSSLRAAVDTEIEVQETPAGRCAEVMKQRDLGTKGERIGFHLEQVHVGVTKWGKPASTCVVKPAEAPEKEAKGKRMGEVEGAVVEFLAQRKVGVRKAEVAKHFEGRYERSNVYRAIRSLVTAQAVHEAAGMVCIAEVAK